MKEAVKREKKNIMQKNRALKKLGFRDTSTESSSCCQYLYIVRRGRQEGRKNREVAVRRERG